jgi:Phage stabilisation protein
MPYSKNPIIQTYETKRVNFIANPQQRGTSKDKDFRLVNMMTEVIQSPIGDQKKYYVKSRPGLTKIYDTQAAAGRGLYYWVVSGTSYAMAAVGNKIYSNGTAVLTLTTSSGQVGFTEFVNSSGVVSLIVVDGTKGYVFSTPSTYVTITDANFPSPHIPIPIFMDGYVFVAKAASQDIYNSNLNDPTNWTGSGAGFISAEMYPDKIVALSKNNNYIYAIGSNTVEYFYDAGTATGTPLARHQSAVQQFGTVAQASVVQTEKEVIFIGETGSGGHTVWSIDGFKEKEIGIPAIKSALLAEGSSLKDATAFSIRTGGQKVYVINLSTRTLVYSFDTQMWHEWQTGTNAFLGLWGSDGDNGSSNILDRTTGAIYAMDETKFTDNGTAITCSIVSAKLDFDTMNRKFMYRLSLVGDVPDDTLTDSAVSISWSDDDYKTWSTARTLTFNADLPAIFQLGQFRRRAFKITYALPHLLRLEGMEVDINKGGT